MSNNEEALPEEEEITTQELPAYEPSAAVEPSSPKIHYEVKMGAATDLGRIRENNEDKFDFLEPEEETVLARRGRLYAVADGMGGHAAGQIAAEMALKTLFEAYYSEQTSLNAPEALLYGFSKANELTHQTATTLPSRQGMGTTLTTAAIIEDRLLIAHVGDSRAYLIRDGLIRQITEDHSLVTQQLKLGIIDEEQAASSPLKNVITRAVGNEPSVEPDLFEESLQPGDAVVLCSDGLSNAVTPEEISQLILENPPSLASKKMVDLANQRGGADNITVLALKIGEVRKPAARKPTRRTLILALTAAFLLGLALAELWHFSH